jgi:hypothetical protein
VIRSSASPFAVRSRIGVATRLAQVPRQGQTILARHHHVEHDQVEVEPRKEPPGMRRVSRGGRHVAVPDEELLEKPADPLVVIDDQKMRADLGHEPPSVPSR